MVSNVREVGRGREINVSGVLSQHPTPLGEDERYLSALYSSYRYLEYETSKYTS